MKIDTTSPEILKKQLPQFRDDLEIYPGPIESDGSPTYNVFDPIIAQFYKISWTEATILRIYRPGMTLEDLLKNVSQRTTLQVTPEQIILFFDDAVKNNLTVSYRTAETLWLQKNLRKIHPLKWLLVHYLYIRIPIVSPDRFLERTLPFIKFVASPTALKIYLALTVLGLVVLLTNFDEYIHTFTYFFNWQGAISYSLAVIAVKMIHEFSHAYTAKNFNVRVPKMGIVLIVLWPVLYTDITDSWKLANRKQRLAISVAGITAELIIAGIATLAWSLTSAGTLQSIFFVVSSITWVRSLAVNLNPAMRWDGYYILCDLWGMDNLQPRGFALTRWKLRKWLWGMDYPSPEEGISREREAGVIIYTFYTWMYRVILFTSIAFFIFHVFARALGIFFFILEVGIFIIGPIISEAKQLYFLRQHMSVNPRTVITCTVLGLFFAWLILPLPHSMSFPAISAPIVEQVVYVPQDGVVTQIFVKKDSQVKIGEPLVNIVSEELNSEINEKRIEKEILEQQIRVFGDLNQAMEKVPEKIAEWESVKNLLNSLIDKQKQNSINAEITGTVYFWDDKIVVGQHVQQDEILGKIGDLTKIKVVFFVPEGDIKDIQVGTSVKFEPKEGGESFEGKITYINPSQETHLEYPQLASTYGGDIPIANPEENKTTKVENKITNLVMVESYYKVDMEFDSGQSPIRIGLIGTVVYRGVWRSLVVEIYNHMRGVLWREGNF